MTGTAQLFDFGEERDKRRSTSTSTFGVGDRECHDASLFYSRMPAVELAPCEGPPVVIEGPDRIEVGDASQLALPDRCAGLVFTSPPYHVGKDYDSDVTFEDYLDGLSEAFAESFRVLEHGGRILVNSAGLGRKPYLPLPALLAERLVGAGFTLMGEIVWVKRDRPSSMARGTFFSPQHPVMEDLTERIVVAAKGCFGRIPSAPARREAGLPWRGDLDVGDLNRASWNDWSSDIWFVRPESAKRIGHPCPFPEGLAERAVRMHSFVGDLVVDPFAGSGTTCVAARRFGRRYYGVDTDADYVAKAVQRVSGVTQSILTEPVGDR